MSKIHKTWFYVAATYVLTVGALSASAAEKVWVVLTDNGSVAKMSDVECFVAADGSDRFSVMLKDQSPLADVRSASFELRDPASVGSVVADSHGAEVVLDPVGETLHISGLAPGTTVTVDGMDGRTVISLTAASASLDVDVSRLSPAPYVVKAGRAALKFIKK